MKNPINRVLTLAVDANNVPQCPAGAESIWDHVSNQGPDKPELWALYGKLGPGVQAGNAIVRKPILNAVLWEQEPGTYCVQADAEVMALLDPLAAGVELSKYTGNWRWGSMDGEEDDPEKPGQKRAVTDRVVDRGPGVVVPHPTPAVPVVINPAKGLVATAWRPTVPGTVAGVPVDLRLQAENRLPAKISLMEWIRL